MSVTDRCNFRCRYCMPAETYGPGYRFLAKDSVLNFAEIVRVVAAAVRLGVRKVRLTGGEPLLRPELPDLVARLRALGDLDELSLTTNGSLLAQHAGALRAAGLDRVTVSLDALDPTTFERLGGARGKHAAVLEGIAAARAAGFPPPKINAVIQRGLNEDQVVPLARHFRGSGSTLRFIELMDVGGPLAWAPSAVMTRDELLAQLLRVGPLTPLPREPAAVAEYHRWTEGGGEVGMIAAISRPFCGDCTRLRLSAEGKLYGCLFAERGLSLREALRSGAEARALEALVAGFWHARDDHYSEQRGEPATLVQLRPKVGMSALGG